MSTSTVSIAVEGTEVLTEILQYSSLNIDNRAATNNVCGNES